MAEPDLYPPSPPRRSPRPTPLAYRLRVASVLLSLGLFMALYLGLLGASVYGAYWTLRLMTETREVVFTTLLLATGPVMLFLFLLKGLFHRDPAEPKGRIRIEESSQPRLFAFVRRLCAEAGAPFPAAIYLSHEVNAAVFVRRSFLSLLLPQRKNLLIGLGLVEAINVSELKAVLAHEFGHFAQSSMRLGQYVYVANQVVRDIVFSRDRWDRALNHWKRIDIRLSFPAWMLTAIVWALRKALEQLFKLVNAANAALSRQMEFDADRHAVSLTGSDALISALWKAERAGLAQSSAWNGLGSMIGYGKFTSDLFVHERARLTELDAELAKADSSPFIESLKSPYRYGAGVHFQAGDDHAPTMWSTHPSNRERELNAKADYLPLEPVEVSAWDLFDDPRALRRRVTLVAYEHVTGKRPPKGGVVSAKKLEDEMRADREEQDQARHYHGFYADRFIEPGDLQKLADQVDARSPEDRAPLREAALDFAGERLVAFMARMAADEEEDKPFEKRAADGLPGGQAAKQLEARRKARRERFALADAALFRHFYARADADPVINDELVQRYEFLRDLEEQIRILNGAESIFGLVMKELQGPGELPAERFQRIRGGFIEVRARLEQVLAASAKLRTPPLSHLKTGTRVRAYLTTGDLVDLPDKQRLDGAWIGELAQQLGTAVSRARRLHFKNLGALLRLQERLDPELYGLAAPPPPEEPEGDEPSASHAEKEPEET